MQDALRIGLTGGIGSGKTTVATMLAGHGAAVIDADAISRQITAPGGAAIDQLRHEFGAEFITPDGALDRSHMRDLVFSQPEARRRLEAIVHPLIGQETARQTHAALTAGHRCIVFDVPLLAESAHWRQRVDRVLVVDCSPQVQRARAMHRSQLTQGAVEKIMASQVSRSTRLRVADMVIFNDTLTLDELAREVREIATCFGL